MVCKDPGHGHLDGELDAAAHGQLQEELPEPELGQVTALLQSFCNAQRIPVSPHYTPGGGSEGMIQEAAAAALLLGMECFSRMSLVLNPQTMSRLPEHLVMQEERRDHSFCSRGPGRTLKWFRVIQ